MKTRVLQAVCLDENGSIMGEGAEARPRTAATSGAGLDLEVIAEAADLLRRGQVVAIPTETVYGLAANALDEDAVARIYEAKGRPANNPLIVHVASAQQARMLVENWPAEAQLLAEAFWPGPLTLVLRKRAGVVPDITTGGGETVAIRCPNHPVALELIRQCGFPLAAPSANISNALSPTLAAHVETSLGGRIPLILDGGACRAGIESTVLDLSGDRPTILRPGVLTAHFLAEVLERRVEQATPATSAAHGEAETVGGGGVMLSPGQLPTHYSPRTPMYLATAEDFPSALLDLAEGFDKIVVLRLGSRELDGTGPAAGMINMPDDPVAYANRLYAVLHELDSGEFGAILVETPREAEPWRGVLDRLGRAGRRWSKRPK